MVNYNIILYVGLFLIISGFILFVRFEIKKRQLDIEQARQARLDKKKGNDLMSKFVPWRTIGLEAQ